MKSNFRNLLCLLPVFILFSCNQPKPMAQKSAPAKTKHKEYNPDNNKQYSSQQLEFFLDSVGHLPTQPLADKVAFGADSVFRSQRQMDTLVSASDMEILKRAVRKGGMPVAMAKQIFNDALIDSCRDDESVQQGLIPLTFYSFDKSKDDHNEYAICIGNPEHCRYACLYFFKMNKIIARKNAYNRYGLELKHYKDSDGKTIIYHIEEFDDGSGIWWNNYFFYKYDGTKLISILNELRNGNMQGFLGLRVLWLESTIQKTNPLTIKMVYYGNFYDMNEDGCCHFGPRVIDDSTTVEYHWDEHSKTLQGQYSKSKISKAQILSYYLWDNDLLFMNAYYPTLKAALRDTAKRKLALEYLNKVKNVYGR
jgi:hypothetical protein